MAWTGYLRLLPRGGDLLVGSEQGSSSPSLPLIRHGLRGIVIGNVATSSVAAEAPTIAESFNDRCTIGSTNGWDYNGEADCLVGRHNLGDGKTAAREAMANYWAAMKAENPRYRAMVYIGANRVMHPANYLTEAAFPVSAFSLDQFSAGSTINYSPLPSFALAGDKQINNCSERRVCRRCGGTPSQPTRGMRRHSL